ncbi:MULTISPECIES: acyl-CoA dehydrogenase family protein [Carboxydothermus]|uniref:Acyl-CoA dehydrogenase, short-chain specific n=2 Tax=Carboxydothermus TaxID=129957 RepID=Q3ABC0_CARHZ|nr:MULTISPECIES: acyl-CoA dehydrogenase family protein [Carboxydothermus]ABB14411.1 acyl-CoA dehydrogenase, short-chain specific [Carboxydothermus hydrogenoformans Z-2901]NYE58449.1 acyl-CoA dehydrogenase [Carboxydothermus ferrireducens DSM 11255]
MDFTISEELQMMVQTVKDFVDNEVDPISQQIDEEDRVPEEIIQKARELGLFGLSIPEEYGGVGSIGMLGKCIIYEQLGRTANGFTTLIGAHTGIGTTGIVELGTEEQKRRYLPDLASGKKLAAFALTEPEAGSDAASIRTTAVKKGDRYILNGVKHFITNGPDADVFTIIAVTDKSKGAKGGITAFIVEKNFPGFKVGTIEKKMGLRGSHTSEIILEDCEVPEENVLGNVGEGYINALKILAKGRVGLAARCVGSMQKLLELSTRYAQQRVQFGKPISSFQAIQHMLAEMAVDIEATRWFAYRVAWLVDQGAKVIKEAAAVKLFASEAYGRVVDKAVQIFGGMGYMKEFPIERYYRDARITRIYEGTSEIQKNIIASQILKELG